MSRAVTAAAKAYAEACADEEMMRVAANTPHNRALWDECCTVTQERLSDLMRAAKTLVTDRPTGPPDVAKPVEMGEGEG